MDKLPLLWYIAGVPGTCMFSVRVRVGMGVNDRDSRTLSLAIPSAGTTLSHYEIINKLGSGGMGEVFLARDTLLDRRVAIKFLSPLLCTDDNARRRFEREARAAARINHRNVVMIHEVGELDRQPYIVMEHVDGIPLNDRINASKLGIQEAIRLSIGIADGLVAAHQQAVIHRDLKPANIIIDAEGTPKIADFGLADVRGTTEHATPGMILGTIGYMSPEQASGSTVDERSDIFAFGIIMYELLSGVSPFRGTSTAESLAKLNQMSHAPLHHLCPSIPRSIEELVASCLHRDPTERPQTAQSIVGMLRGSVEPVGGKVASLTPESTARRRLAVVPFEDYTGGDAKRRIGEMISTLLITGLSEQRSFSVVSHQRLMDLLSLEGRQTENAIERSDAIRLARRAGAQHLLTGCVLQQSPLLVTAQLVEVETGDVAVGFRVAGQPHDAFFSIVDSLLSQVREHFAADRASSQPQLVSITDVTTNSPEAYRCYLEGERFFNQVYEDEARAAFEEAIRLDPTFAMAYYALARMAVPDRAALMSKAVKYSERATEKERLYILSFDARLHGRFQEAIDHLEAIIKRFPDEKYAHFRCGALYHRRADYDTAITYLRKAIELDPLFCQAYNQLAYCYSLSGKFEDALWAINQYINLAPDEPNPHDSRAEILAFNGRVEAAMASYREALKRKADMPGSLLRLAACYILTGRYEEARECHVKVSSLARRFAWTDPPLYPAFISMRQGKLQEALRSLQWGIEEDELDPGRVYHVANKRYQIGSIHYRLGELDRAKIEIDTALDTYQKQRWFEPDFCTTELNELRIRTLLDLGQVSVVESTLKMAEEHIKSGSEVHWINRMDHSIARAIWLSSRCDNNAIVAESTEVLNRMSHWPGGRYFGYLRLLAKSLLELGRADRTIELFSKLISTYAESRLWHALDDVPMHYYLGLAYEQSGWKEKAAEQYRTLIDIWRDADTEFEELQQARNHLTALTR